MIFITAFSSKEALRFVQYNHVDIAFLDIAIGRISGMLTDSDMLRNLIARADEKMYESKREKNCVS